MSTEDSTEEHADEPMQAVAMIEEPCAHEKSVLACSSKKSALEARKESSRKKGKMSTEDSTEEHADEPAQAVAMIEEPCAHEKSVFACSSKKSALQARKESSRKKGKMSTEDSTEVHADEPAQAVAMIEEPCVHEKSVFACSSKKSALEARKESSRKKGKMSTEDSTEEHADEPAQAVAMIEEPCAHEYNPEKKKHIREIIRCFVCKELCSSWTSQKHFVLDDEKMLQPACTYCVIDRVPASDLEIHYVDDEDTIATNALLSDEHRINRMHSEVSSCPSTSSSEITEKEN